MLIWRVVNGILLVYLLLIALRLMLSWFQRSVSGRPWDLLVRVTEPYLAPFRRLRFLRVGLLDLSPIAAILVLVVALDLVGALRLSVRLTLGIFLASLTGALWSGVSFLILLFLIILVILIVTYRRGAGSPTISAMATLVHPLVELVSARIARFLSPRKPLGGLQILLLTAALLLILLIGGRALVSLLRVALLRLPV